MGRPLGAGCVQLLCLVLLLLATGLDVRFARAVNSRPTSRLPIKINPGPPAAMPTPSPPSHTFRLPDPDPDPAPAAPPTTPQNQADAIRAAKLPGHKPPPPPASRPPAHFTLPPPLLADWLSPAGSAVFEEALWRRWDGDCMEARLDDYRYALCPFHNITQRGLRMTRLNVVLGVWSSWWTTPSHQLAMNYTDGTSCDDGLNRSTTLILHCSAPHSITQSVAPLPPIDYLAEYSPSYIAAVDEPSPCMYRMHWHTPLVCSAYRKVADELAWRRQQQGSQSPPTADVQHEYAASKRREQLEREMAEDEEADKVVGARELPVLDSAEVRGYLDCIAAMSASEASAVSYRSACAGYLPSSQSANTEGVT